MNAKPQAMMTMNELENELETVMSTRITNDRFTEKRPGGGAVAIRIHFEIEGEGRKRIFSVRGWVHVLLSFSGTESPIFNIMASIEA